MAQTMKRQKLVLGGRDGYGLQDRPLVGQLNSIAAVQAKGNGGFVAGMSNPLLTTWNDMTRGNGYEMPAPLRPFTTRYDQPVGSRITDSQNDTTATYYDNKVHGPKGTFYLPAAKPLAWGRQELDVFPADRLPVWNYSLRPKSVPAPYVRSWLNDGMLKDAVDYNLRNNLTSNEWQTAIPMVFERGNGFAISGPAYIGTHTNADTF